MKPFVLLLGILTILLVIIGIAQFYNPIPDLTGVPHPKFKGMKISPSNTDMYTHTKWLGYFFAVGLIAMFTTILIIGSRRAEKNTGMIRGILVFGIIYTILFSIMIYSNWAYVYDSDHTFFGQMPRPTAWVIYVIWLTPLIVTGLYVFNFNRWVISKEEERELKKWIALNVDK
ncbi:MAG: hypothetical protein V3V00_10830 [Saprospiraceae bacterium]